MHGHNAPGGDFTCELSLHLRVPLRTSHSASYPMGLVRVVLGLELTPAKTGQEAMRTQHEFEEQVAPTSYQIYATSCSDLLGHCVQ